VKLIRKTMNGAAEHYDSRREFQIKFLKQHGLRRDYKLLDVGCGNLRGGIPIIKYLDVGNYYGVDVRKIALDDGKLELKEKKLLNKKPSLRLIKSFSEIELDVKFDVIWAFSVIFHLSDDILDECLALVAGTLDKDGRFFFNPNLGKQGEHKKRTWLQFPVVYRTMRFYEEKLTRHGLYLWDTGFNKMSSNWLVAKQDSQGKRTNI